MSSSFICAETEECPICAEEYNTNSQSKVKCEYCPMESCRSCCERYICSKATTTCMDTKCGREWSRRFIDANFTQAFISGPLKKHRENILFENERETFPETIQKMAALEPIQKDLSILLSILNPSNAFIIEGYRIDRSLYYTLLSIYNLLFDMPPIKNTENNFNFIDIFLVHIDYHIDRIFRNILLFRKCDETHVQYEKIAEYVAASQHLNIERLTAIFRTIINILRVGGGGGGDEEVKVKEREIINQCPSPSCNGVLDANWYCILCKNTTCSSCMETINSGDEHKCNNDTVETVKLMKTDTKTCPKCKANIYKIDGCDQMWCTQCHTAFSWKTGEIEKKIHNPHYYEWLRSKSANGVIPRTDADANTDTVLDPEIEAIINANANANAYCDGVALNEQHMAALITNVNKYIRNVDKGSVNSKELYRFEDEVRHVIHLTQDELIKYAPQINNNRIDSHNKFVMKMNYLNNKITEKEYKNHLENEEMKKEMNVEIYQLIDTWIVVKTDILKRFMYRIDNAVKDNQKMEYHDIAYEIDELKEFMKSHLREIEKIYKNKIYIKMS